MIKTSSEGTSYCPQCEAYAREVERLNKVVVAAEEYYTFPSSHNRMNLKTALAALREGKNERSRDRRLHPRLF